jgi:hypothetical protein
MRIGIDLDNTLICYDGAFVAAAKARGLIEASFTGGKQQVRDALRQMPDGEQVWQALQGYVYGAGIENAALFDGAVDFLSRAKAAGHDLYIISHKTEFGHFDPLRINLRDAASNFLRTRGIFEFVPESLVSFHTTRDEKIQRIADVGCEWFIDDLLEVLDDPAFPATIRKFWFTDETERHPTLENYANWGSLTHGLLG